MIRSPGTLLLLACAFVLAAAAPHYSELWGERGEAWNPQSRLPDFSYAGYHRGEEPLPETSLDGAVNVRDFGAAGDGVADDTQAFLDAIEAVDGGVLYIPPGRYKITDIIEIRKSNLVIAGAGPEQTTLFFPTPLNDIRPNWGETTSGRPTSNYSWSGGFLWLRGSFGQVHLARIVTEARRGDTTVQVSSAHLLEVGQEVEIYQKDTPDNSLAIHLYSGDAGSTSKLSARTTATLTTVITAIDGDIVTFDRPLRFDVNQRWDPAVRSFRPTVREVGIENLRFEFPNTDYQGHFTELGFNPIAFTRTAHCWVRNIRIVNADSGFFVAGRFNTIRDVWYESERKADSQRQSTGHHGIYLSDDDNLFTDFDFGVRLIHDITVSHCAGNVIANGRGVDLTFDHHKRVPYENLFTNIDAGEGSRLWLCGGGADLGKHCGARGTFWNIRSRAPLRYPPPRFGPPSMNLVGLNTDQPGETAPDGRWFEALDPSRLQPRNLHQAQLARRLGREPRLRDAAGLRGSISPGSLATLFGDFPVSATQANEIPLPRQLGGLEIRFRQGGREFSAPLLFVSSDQVNLQTPWGLRTGRAAMEIVVSGVARDPVDTYVATYDYGLFTLDFGPGRAVAQNIDGSLAHPEGSVNGFVSRAARVGEPLLLYSTGLGPLTGPPPEDGANSTDGSGRWFRRDSRLVPRVLIGGREAPVYSSVLSPQFTGVYQVNVLAVPDVAAGPNVSLRIESPNGSSASRGDVTIAVAAAN